MNCLSDGGNVITHVRAEKWRHRPLYMHVRYPLKSSVGFKRNLPFLAKLNFDASNAYFD